MTTTGSSPLAALLIDNDKTSKADRIKALIARAAAYDRKEQIDRAIGDYDTALRLDPALADIFNAQGRTLAQEGRPAAARLPISAPRSSSIRTIPRQGAITRRWPWSWSASVR